MSNELSISSVNGTSTALNGQKGQGGQKPNMGKGNSNPGGTKPPKPPEGSVPNATGR